MPSPDETFKSVSYKSNSIDQSQHPNPLAFFAVPYKQFFQLFINEYVDCVVERDCLVDWIDGWIDWHAIVGGVVVQDLSQ